MDFHVANVVQLLAQKFLVKLPSTYEVSRKDKKMADHLASILQQALKALKFYRQTNQGSRPLKSMTKNFRWITTLNHMDKLRKFEQERDDMKESRTELLRVLGKKMFEVVKEKLEKGISIHDNDLMFIARDINKNEIKVENFKASQTWITRWKNSHGIVSRKITKFVTRKCMTEKSVIIKHAEDFVNDCRNEMTQYQPCEIFNADQCGIQKELYGARALAFQGEKRVERVVQATSSLTHSFTFMPMIFVDGTLGPKAYMVLKEQNGIFPPTRPIPNCPNLVVRASMSHIMTKDLMCDWLRSCVFHPSAPKKMLMIVDSWQF